VLGHRNSLLDYGRGKDRQLIPQLRRQLLLRKARHKNLSVNLWSGWSGVHMCNVNYAIEYSSKHSTQSRALSGQGASLWSQSEGVYWTLSFCFCFHNVIGNTFFHFIPHFQPQLHANRLRIFLKPQLKIKNSQPPASPPYPDLSSPLSSQFSAVMSLATATISASLALLSSLLSLALLALFALQSQSDRPTLHARYSSKL